MYSKLYVIFLDRSVRVQYVRCLKYAYFSDHGYVLVWVCWCGCALIVVAHALDVLNITLARVLKIVKCLVLNIVTMQSYRMCCVFAAH